MSSRATLWRATGCCRCCPTLHGCPASPRASVARRSAATRLPSALSSQRAASFGRAARAGATPSTAPFARQMPMAAAPPTQTRAVLRVRGCRCSLRASAHGASARAPTTPRLRTIAAGSCGVCAGGSSVTRSWPSAARLVLWGRAATAKRAISATAPWAAVSRPCPPRRPAPPQRGRQHSRALSTRSLGLVRTRRRATVPWPSARLSLRCAVTARMATTARRPRRRVCGAVQSASSIRWWSRVLARSDVASLRLRAAAFLAMRPVAAQRRCRS